MASVFISLNLGNASMVNEIRSLVIENCHLVTLEKGLFNNSNELLGRKEEKSFSLLCSLKINLGRPHRL